MISRRRLGYLVWGVAGLVIAVPEITAAADDEKALPFTTISAMVGHLERHHTWVELIVVALIVFAVFSSIRMPPVAGGGEQLGRTPAGRLTLAPPAAPPSRREYGSADAPGWFLLAAFLSFALITGATLAAIKWWDDENHYQPAYVLYGLIGLLWLVIPGLIAFALGKDAPFPTLFQTVVNLEDWLRGRGRFGPLLAWAVSYVIVAGLVILLLHLTLYPYPDITHIINPNG